MVLSAIAFVWELPQNLLGLGCLAFHRAAGNIRALERANGRLLIELNGDGGVSLGHFVFHTKHDSSIVPVGPENREHELGHAVQSRALGPLYLPLVGVPSTMRVAYAALYRLRTGRRWAGYYDGWPENAADRLGGVDRSIRPKP
jgi:hypothetical protein